MVTACLSSILLNNDIQNNTKIFVTFLVFSPVTKVFKKVRNRCAECGYKLSEGDILWHKSMLTHHARNTGGEKVVYITVGTPPSFMSSMV